jgi:hypothetical protein
VQRLKIILALLRKIVQKLGFQEYNWHRSKRTPRENKFVSENKYSGKHQYLDGNFKSRGLI